MGYTSEFQGSIKVEPPLSAREAGFLNEFAGSRRMDRAQGPYHCGSGFMGQGHEPDIRDYNAPPPSQPGLWCKWEASEDGSEISWNGAEKFYASAEWMAYIRTHFLVGLAAKAFEPEAMEFLRPHAMSGLIHVVGEEPLEDVWRMKVDADGVWTSRGSWTAAAVAGLGIEDDMDGGSYVEIPGMSEFLDMARGAGMVEWGEWERVPDYHDPKMEAQVAALRDRSAVESAAGPGKAGPASLSL